MQNKIRKNGLIIMAKLVALLGNFAYFLIFAIINGSLGYLCAMGVTIFGSIALAKLFGEAISLSYTFLIVLTILCGLLRGLLRYIEQYSNHYIAFKLLAIIRDKIFKTLRRLAPSKLDDKKKGDLISMVTADIETLEVFYAHTLSPILICVVVSTIVLVFVGIMSSWYLSLVALLFYLIIGVMIPLITSKKLKKDGVIYRRELASFNAFYLDSIKGVRDILLHNQENERGKEVNLRSNKLLKETKNIKDNSTKSSSFTEFIVSLCIIITLFIGIVLVRNSSLSIGRMIIGVVCIFNSFGPVIAISNLPSDLTQTFASGDRILSLLEEKTPVEDIKNKNNIDFENLKIENLSFAYDKETILNNINLTVNKGEIIGIIGKSGCGKSTLLKLIMRFYKKDSGYIKLNDIDIEDINTSSLLDNVTLVSQNTYLFDDTILENLKIAKENATDEEIVLACKQASIHDFIMSLENGYNTKVGTFLDNISAGEKQRIGLARAFLRGSKLILLDEPTSNVDSMNEGIILKSLLLVKKDKCIILVSHRESTISICDRKYEFIDKQLHEI